MKEISKAKKSKEEIENDRLNKFLQQNSPKNLFFKASNLLAGQKMPIHKSKGMVSSIVAAIYHTSP